MLSIQTETDTQASGRLNFDARIRRVAGSKSDAAAVIEYAAELKFDGWQSACATRNGFFVRGATRGDGTTGEDVTQNLRTMRKFRCA